MSFTQIDSVESEAFEPRPLPREVDLVSEQIGSPVYVQNHRIDLHLPTPVGLSPRLTVSRFYWNVEPPVAVDFRGELRAGDEEIAAKQAWFAARDIRYLLVQDEWDEEAVLIGTPVISRPAIGAPPEPTPVQKPKAAPRKPRSAPRRP